MNRWVFAVSAAALVATGCAVPLEEDVGDRAEPLIDAQIAEDFDAVVNLVLHHGSAPGGACSGSLIAPRVVLTARHCVANEAGDGVTDPADITVHLGPTYWEVEGEYDVLEIRIPEGRWDWEEMLTEETFMTSLRMTDVAVLILDERATPEPLPVDFGPLNSLVAHEVYIVGYGRTPFDGAGVKRRGAAWVLETLEDRAISTDGISCPGDSGGPLIDEAGAIRAVVSGGLSCDRERTNSSWFVGVHDFQDLIAGAVADAEGCGPAETGPDCAAPPEPMVEPPAETPPPPAAERSAGCAASGAGAAPWASGSWLLLALLAISRRRA